MTKNHVWRIKKDYFHQLKSGEKNLEIRVGYPQIKKVCVGDTITFENYGQNLFEVKAKRAYPSFKALLANESIEQILPGMTRDGALRTLHGIYPPDKEKLGIYAFELKPVDKSKPETLLIYRASQLLKEDANKKFAETMRDCYLATDWICKDYPNYCDHFYTKYIPGIFDGTREIFVAYSGSEFAGMIILKKAVEVKDADNPAAAKPFIERKICTLYVEPKFQKMGIATKLIQSSFDWLGTTKPLLSIADYKIPQFGKVIKKYGWEKTQILRKGYYNDNSTEYVFNGTI